MSTQASAVKIGASVTPGVDGLEWFECLKLGNFILTAIPTDFDEALALAERCRRDKIFFAFSEFLFRGSRRLLMSSRRPMPRKDFFTRAQLDRILAAGGRYYMGRLTLGEVGGLLYWPREYTLGRACGNYLALPPAGNVRRARELYRRFIRNTLRFERDLSGGPLLDVDSSMTFRDHLAEGIDIPVIESMPGDPEFLIAALRGAARAYARREWGVHIAMHCYGGGDVCDRLWLQRWRTALYHAYLSGATFIYPESGHYGKGRHGYASPEIRMMRASLREVWQFAAIHDRPAGYPETRIAVVHGHLDGYAGLWNPYVWGQYQDGEKWLNGDAEAGWDLFEACFRKQNWANPDVVGETDCSGHPPGGLVDILPAEAPAEVFRRYGCLVFLGWNTMTEELYGKLKAFVAAGGHLIMALPHLNIETDRARPMRMFRNGRIEDLFGIRVLGPGSREVSGIHYVNRSRIPGYRFTTWSCDPKFIGDREHAHIELRGARVLAGLRQGHRDPDTSDKPILVEHRHGKGFALLLTTWSWPGANGTREIMRDVLRAVLAGESAPLRVNGSDRLRHAVYRSGGLRALYVLNTDPDHAHAADIRDRTGSMASLTVPPADLGLCLLRDCWAVIPADKRVRVLSWKTGSVAESTLELALPCTQTLRLVNCYDKSRTLVLNGKRVEVPARKGRSVPVKRRIDPDRPMPYNKGFLEEPPLAGEPNGGLPY